jgi:hypothetical protein
MGHLGLVYNSCGHKLMNSDHEAHARKSGCTLYVPKETTYPDTLVLILGWMGTTNRYLRHYANFYSQKMGLACVTSIAPGLQFWSEWYAKRCARSVLDFLNTLECKKIVVHAMSNNGGYQWAIMLQLMEEEKVIQFCNFAHL